MNSAQVAAFQAASGTNISALSMFILTLVFVAVLIFAVIEIKHVLHRIRTENLSPADVGMIILRVLIVVVVVLILVSRTH